MEGGALRTDYIQLILEITIAMLSNIYKNGEQLSINANHLLNFWKGLCIQSIRVKETVSN